MTVFQEDMLFKNIAEEDVQTLLEIFGKKSKTTHIWTKELRILDPATYKPDLILELDDQNLIVEFQSTKVDDDFSRRAHVYVAITDQKKENNKKVNLEVISTAESSKIVRYEFSDSSVFVYKVTGLQQFDGEKVIKDVQEKLRKNEKISSKESIYLALAPLMIKEDMENNIKLVVDILIQIEEIKPETRILTYGIEWFVADKYIEEEESRIIIIIQDLLGDRMSAVYEYGERKEKKGIEKGIEEGMKKGIEKGIEKGMEKVILKLNENGMEAEEIAIKTEMDLKTIENIINKNQNKKN